MGPPGRVVIPSKKAAPVPSPYKTRAVKMAFMKAPHFHGRTVLPREDFTLSWYSVSNAGGWVIPLDLFYAARLTCNSSRDFRVSVNAPAPFPETWMHRSFGRSNSFISFSKYVTSSSTQNHGRPCNFATA